MSGTLSSSEKYFESSVKESGSSMHFWGICCESGKQYAQVVGQRFRITMAVLDPKSFHNDSADETVSLTVIRGGIEYLLCVLKHGEIQQVHLNLIFDKGENVKFYINGHGRVYLSGYQLTDSEGDVMNDENGYLCPLVEIKSKSRKSKLPMKVEPETPPKSSEKTKASKEERKCEAFWRAMLKQDLPEDESDEPFSASDEEGSESEGESSDDIQSEEAEEDLDEEEEEESSSSSSEEEEIERQKIQKSPESRKRRKKEKNLPQKRSRTENIVDNSEDIICIDDNESEEEASTNMNSTIRTPKAKKLVNNESTPKEKKSKKKRLSEISNISIKGHQANVTPVSVSKQSANPVMTLENGVEIQDVIVGKGPVATNGKTLHIFFIGRLPDKTIFDSRLPGKKPFSFVLGKRQVIPGWEVALQGMRVGGKRKIKVPPSMAYGSKGQDDIPPNTTLLFVVELTNVS